MFVCTNKDVDETAPPPVDKPERRSRVREQVVGMWSIAALANNFFLHGQFAQKKKRSNTSIKDFKALMEYAIQYHHGGKRKTPVDVPKMIEKWTDWLATYSTAHDKAEVDKIEFVIDDLLGPLLTAPIRQIRQFYKGLVDSLKADKRVPFFVWSMFSAYGQVIIDKADDDKAIIRLKKKLAEQVTDLVEQHEHVQIDFHEAMVGALMWRDPETLKAIKSDLEAGAKPRVKGRQSCLFLITKHKGHENTVML
jgi:hypothetical protein